MKVLNINSYYYSSSVHRELQNVILAQGIDSVTYVPLVKGYVARDECLYESQDNVQISECYNKLDKYFFHVKHNKILDDIKQRIKIEKFDCLHAHSLFSNGYIAMKIKEKYGIPYIVAVRSTDLNVFFKYMVHLRGLGQRILKEADRIVFLSQPYRDILIQNYVSRHYQKEILEKCAVVPNGIDSFWFKNIGTPKRILDKACIKLIHVGALSKRKNVSTSVKATQILKNKGYNATLTVVGKVVDKSTYYKIKKLPYINYITPKPKEELIEIYRANDILVMPSVTETFGLVYAEAMSQGLPVIYTKGQGFDGQFEEGLVGYGVNCYNAEEIATRIIDILGKYNEHSKKCIELCGKFNWDLIAQKYSSIYRLY